MSTRPIPRAEVVGVVHTGAVVHVDHSHRTPLAPDLIAPEDDETGNFYSRMKHRYSSLKHRGSIFALEQHQSLGNIFVIRPGLNEPNARRCASTDLMLQTRTASIAEITVLTLAHWNDFLHHSQ